jgi:hypothetical protein
LCLLFSTTLDFGVQVVCRESIADTVGSPAVMSFCLSLETLLQPYEDAPRSRPTKPSGVSGGAAAGALRPPQPAPTPPVPVPDAAPSDAESQASPIPADEPALPFQPVGITLSVLGKGCPGELWGAAAFSLGGKLYIHGGLAPPDVAMKKLMSTPVFDLVGYSFERKYHTRAGIRDLLVKHVVDAPRTLVGRLAAGEDVVPRTRSERT